MTQDEDAHNAGAKEALEGALGGELRALDRDEQQIVGVNYFNQFALADSATRNDEALSKALGYGGFETAEQFQRALWWYNGSVGLFWARPPVVPDEVVQRYPTQAAFVDRVRTAIPELPTDDGALPTDPLVPDVVESIPTMFVCGAW